MTIVLLHGVGATASALLPVAEAVQRRVLRPAACILLDAPEPHDSGTYGRQWFSLIGATTDVRRQRAAVASPYLAARLEAVAAAEGRAGERLRLFGFSQGATMALWLAFTGAPLDRVASWALRDPGVAPLAWTGAPRLLIAHGAADPVIPFAEAVQAASRCARAGWPVEFHATEDTLHQMDDAALDRAAAFLTA